MEPTVACALDPDSGDRGPVELARVAATLLGGRVLTVVVRPGGSAAERLARLGDAPRARPGAGGRVLTVVVRPGGSAAERLSRLENAHGAEPETGDVPRFGHANRREIQAPSPAAGLHRVLAEVRPALLVAGSPMRAAHGRVGLG